jgi:K+:H+ antiporter
MDLILTVSVSLAAALALGYGTQRLGLSPLVGYLVAGIIVGPNTPGFIANHVIAEQLAEIGIVLLMFGVGLHFDLKDLLSVRRFALPGAVGQSALATAVGAAAAISLGGAGSLLGSIVYGLALSVASTVVITRVLTDNDDLHTPAGHAAVGWTIVEDLLTVLILVLLPVIAPGGPRSGPSLVLALGIAVVKIGALVAVLFLIGARVIPWLLKKVAATRSRELFTLTILVMALGIAFGSSQLFGVSMALGAFLAGMVVGRSDFSLRAASEALPMRDAFAVLFFVSVGMLFDPTVVVQAPWLVGATVAIVIIGKPLVSFLLALALGQSARTGLLVGLALGQIGEFSFILAGVANALGIFPPRATSAIIVAAIVSIALNPLLRRLVDPVDSLARRARRQMRGAAVRLSDTAVADAARPPGDSAYHAVVVGYGPVGRTLVRLLGENDIACTVIEMNLDTVRRLRLLGQPAVYGDAAHAETLRGAGIERSTSIILSPSGLRAPQEIIRLARELNPNIQALVRSAYLSERPALQAAGADLVFSEEGEVALAMNEAILRDLGAAPQKIERERKRLRKDLFDDQQGP